MATKTNKKTTSSKVTVSRKPEASETTIGRFQPELNRQSIVSLILGVLIVFAIGGLIFNYLTKPRGEVTTDQQVNQTQQQQTADVSKDNLPGKYTVKEGDTLFLIAQSYYNDGFQFQKIVEANKIQNPDNLEVGQVLDLPKIETTAANQAQPSETPAATVAPTLEANNQPANNATTQTTEVNTNPQNLGQGGATNQTIWGETISGDTYTVQNGDWLSKIAGRAYGDIMAYQKIAQANNIADPNVIEPGTVLQIPR